MATLRTYEEKAAIVEHCVELERTGGDILGYLWSENYISPRATWCNFQREWLGRKPYEYTDGKPKAKGEIRLNKKFKVTPEIRAEAVRLAIAGEDPRGYLTNLGSADAQNIWIKIRAELKDSSPEIYAQLPKRIPRKTVQAKKIHADVIRKTAEKTPTPTFEEVKKSIMEIPQIKVDGPIRIETPEADNVEIVEAPEISLGDAMAGIAEAADEFFQSCEDAGLNLNRQEKITQPLCYDGMTVREIEGLFGRYRRTDIHGATYVDFENPDGADVMSYTVEQWKKLRAEQVNAFRILGVEL